LIDNRGRTGECAPTFFKEKTLVKKSRDESVRLWERLSEAGQANPRLRALFHRELALLKQSAHEVRALLIKRSRVAAEQQILTQECAAALTKGNDLCIRMRLAVKATLGPKDERLTQFGIKPRRGGKKTPAP
jgi:hypothetical protein